jgi:hypothetical protein
MVTLQQVLDAEPDRYLRASVAWNELADGLDAGADAMMPKLARLTEAWEEGPASAAGLTRYDNLRKELAGHYPALVGMSQQLSRFGEALRRLRNQTLDLVDRGRAVGITRDSAGAWVVTKDPQSPVQVENLRKIRAEEDDIVRAAQDLDGDVARRIATLGPPPPGTTAFVPKDSIPAKGTDPKLVAAWWNGLTPLEQQYVQTEYPALIGALDGVPSAARDIANRIVLDNELDRYNARRQEIADRLSYLEAMHKQGCLGEVYPNAGNPLGAYMMELRVLTDQKADVDGKLKGLNGIDNRLDTSDTTLPRGYLLGLDTSGDGKAIVAMGDPDGADNVFTYIPGTQTELSWAPGEIRRTDVMVRDANVTDRTHQTVGIWWLGYDAPDQVVPNAISDSYAEAGAPDLRRFQDGLRVTHDTGSPSHNTVVGHSYGSTVAGQAASESAGLDADELILVGSPGVEVDQASDLNINGNPADHVWATTARNDPIQHAGLDDNLVHGENPAGKGFGGRVFTSDPGTPQFTWEDGFNFVDAHLDYWEDGNPARTNMANIITGRPEQVS